MGEYIVKMSVFNTKHSKKVRSLIPISISAALLVSLWRCISSVSEKKEPEQDSSARSYYDRLLKCKEQIEEKTDFKPDIVLILGTGLGDYADSLEIKASIPYKDIEG